MWLGMQQISGNDIVSRCALDAMERGNQGRVPGRITTEASRGGRDNFVVTGKPESGR